MFSTDFIFRQQENLVDNQECQAGFRPLCNKILFILVCFWADWAVACQVSTILLKSPTFEGFYHILMGKTNKKLEFLHIIVSAIKS